MVLITNQHGKGNTMQGISKSTQSKKPHNATGPIQTGGGDLYRDARAMGNVRGRTPYSRTPLSSIALSLLPRHPILALKCLLIPLRTKFRFFLQVLASPIRSLLQSMLCRCNMHRFVHINPAGVGLCSGCDHLFYTTRGVAYKEIDESKRDRRTRRNVMKGIPRK